MTVAIIVKVRLRVQNETQGAPNGDIRSYSTLSTLSPFHVLSFLPILSFSRNCYIVWG